MEFWVFLLTGWAFYFWVRTRIQRQKEDERFTNVINALNRIEPRLSDLKKLESRIAELEHRIASGANTASAAEQPQVSPAPSPTSVTKPVEIQPRVPMPPAAEFAKPPTPVPPPRAAHPMEPPRPHVAEPSVVIPPAAAPPATLPPPKPAPLPLHPPTATRPIPPPLSPPPQPTQLSARERGFQLEELLGKNWLNKLGIIALVIGISMALGKAFPLLSNPAKIAACYFVSFLILGIGVYMERLERYRVFARALIGGGWALVFFVTWAMHFLAYTRVIDTQWVDLLLLFLVAAVMVVHTLRYDSQVVTGLAFLLAFTTVAISQNTIYSLSAGAILALGLVAIVHRRQWYELEVFGILASYGNHFLWLANVIVPANGHHHLFPEFVPSTALLALYWAIYRWSYIARQIKAQAQETVSTLAALLNTSLLLALFKYQSVRPELAFYALLLLGAVELALGQLPVARQRRTAFTILSTIGIILLIAAIPFKYSGMDTAIIWLAEAQMLLLAGVFSREVLFRIFGVLVALLTSGDMLVNQALPKLHERLSLPSASILGYFPQSLPAPDTQLAISFLAAGLLFYADSLFIPRRWKSLIASESEENYFRAFSYLAGLMMLVALWLAFPLAWTAVLWTAAAFLLIVLARSLDIADLNYQAHLFAFAAFFRVLDINALLATPFLHTSLTLRLITLSLVIALFYLCARWLAATESPSALAPSELYTTAAAILFVILSYRECDPVWIGPAWGGFALVLAISGYFRDRRDLSLQAHFLVLAGFARTLLFNLDATREWHSFTFRFLTFTLMAALLYGCAYFSGPRGSVFARLFSALHTWCGSILIAVLAFEEVSSPWIAVAWSVFALLLLIIGNRVKRVQLHFQAYLLSISAFAQAVTVNLNTTVPFHWIPSLSLRFVTLALIAAIFYLCAWWATKADFAPAPLAGAVYTWAASSLIVLCIYREFREYGIALGWAIFALALFEFGIWRNSRNFRAQGYILLFLSFLRLIIFNLDLLPNRLLTFTLPIAFIFYYGYLRLWRLGESSLSNLIGDQEAYVGPILSYLGSSTLVLFTGSYFPGPARFIAWAMLSFAYIGIAYLTPLGIFLSHSVILAFLVSFRALALELQIGGRPAIPGSFSTVFYVAAVAAILFAAQAFAFPLRKRFSAVRKKSSGTDDLQIALPDLFSHPEQIYFFLPFGLVTLLILNEVSFGRVTIAWGLEAVVAFLFALVVGERSFRLAGLGLLLLCVAKIGLLDVWRLHGSDRYVTLIILGVALLLVSYLYTRYSEAIRRYL